MSARGFAYQRPPASDAKKGKPKPKKEWPWYFQVDVTPAGGARKQVKKGGFKTKKAAQEALTAVLAEVQKGAYVVPSRQTVAEYFREWLGSHSVRGSTIASYRRNVEQHVLPRIGTLRLRDLDTVTLNRLYAGLQQDGARRDGKPGGLSARTVSYVATIVGRGLRDAFDAGRIGRNPALAAKRPSTSMTADSKPEMSTWDGHQVERFLTLTANRRYQPAWLLLVTTGVRRGEALGLRWSDVDLESKPARLTVRRSLNAVDHRIIEGPTKTGKARVVELDARTVTSLRTLKAAQAAERLAMGAGYRDDGRVFCHPDGRPYHPERFSREFDRMVTLHGMERIRLHDLRHSWATLALSAGVHPKVVQERLGHSNIGVTLNIYSHTVQGMQSDAAEKVADLIFGGRS